MVQLKEGQDFSNFTLLNCIGENDIVVTWVALDRDLNERVCLKLFKDAVDVDEINSQVEKTKGLIHQHVVRTYNAGIADGVFYICQQYISNARPLDLEDTTFSQAWPVIETLIDTLMFIHSLGLAHGMLHPGNLLIDNDNHLWVNGTGLTINTTGKYKNYLSPDSNRTIDPSDDVYALGCIVYRVLTGNDYQAGAPEATALPADVGAIIERMLEASDYDRTRDLGHVREVLSRYAASLNTSASLTADSFSKSDPPSPSGTLTQAAHRNPRERHQIPTNVVLVGLIILITFAGFVFFFLPESPTLVKPSAPVATTPQPVSRPADVATEKPDELAPMEIAQIEFAREEGKRAASQIIRLQVELEDIGVALWAGEEFTTLTGQAEAGDDLYRQQLYREALAHYQTIIKGLESLKDSAAGALAQNVNRGDSALANGEANTALEAFSIATAIDSEDPTLQQKLARAENLSQVQASIRSAQQAERDGKLDSALEHFKTAAKLDPLWQPALDGANRVRNLIRQRRFADAMSEAFSALAGKEYEKSRQAFERAALIIPDSTEPEDGLLQIELAIRMDRIDALKASAEAYVETASWQAAIDDYQAVLALDQTLIFASTGLTMAQVRLELDNRLQRFLNDPTLMKDDSELASARQAIVDASKVSNKNSRLRNQINALSRLISVARIPINILITSDNKTDVTVYQVGQFGKLSSTSMELFPGRYTIVGKRPGYRDVQHTLHLVAGKTVEPISIVCTEKI